MGAIGTFFFIKVAAEEVNEWVSTMWKDVYVHGNGGHASVIRDMLCQAKLPLNAAGRAVIGVGDNKARMREATSLEKKYKFVSVYHPSSSVSRLAKIGEGTVVMAGAVVQAGAKIGRHVIVNTGASVDHDCIVGDFAHIAPGVHLCGGVEVGAGALVGVGSCAVPGAKIEAWSLTKAGSVCT